MKKIQFAQVLTLTLILLALPTFASAQGSVAVSSVLGQVEWKTVSATRFTPLQASTQVVHVGDQIRTGPGSQLVLMLPDSSYMVVSENSTLTIQDFWGASVRNIVNLMLGKARFYIQHVGGPNPYRVQTPTALIAVKGTIFDVIVDEPKSTVVECLDGRVTVETVGLSDREVILDAGKHTLVREGSYPVMPIAANEPLIKSRILPVIRKEDGQSVLTGKDSKADDKLLRDNDRLNRTSDPLQAPRSINGSTDVQRAKPTLQYPPK